MLTLISALDATLAGSNAAQGRIRSNVVCVSTAKIEMSRVLLPVTGAKRIGSNRVVSLSRRLRVQEELKEIERDVRPI